MMQRLLSRLTSATIIFLSGSGLLLGQYRVCATGQLDNSWNFKASKQACESGDFDCVFSEYTIEEYNALTAQQLRQNCDIVVYGFNSNNLLKCDPNATQFEDCTGGETLYTLHIEPFLNMGGGVIFENPSEGVDLLPGVESVRIWPVNTDWCSVAFTQSVPGLTDGILDGMGCFYNSNPACISNFHQKFVNWNPYLSTFIVSEGVRSQVGGGSVPDPDCNGGASIGLYGQYPGGGRVLMMGVDNDYHGANWDLGPAGDGSLRRNYNQYQFMLNELEWVAPVTCPDSDGDGYSVCEGDCNDSDPSVNPAASESCNGTDDNCNGQIDEGFDSDGDGFTTCAGDCVDSDPSINPGAIEICNGIDDDCDGLVDGGGDNDGDGFNVCAGDCNDSDPLINPAAPEVCNGKDDNCDGLVDEGFDSDGDGVTVCGGDCNDLNPAIFPGATEVCGDSIDNNCNGQVDEWCTSCVPTSPTERGPTCTDGVDNDCDGLVDHADPDCAGVCEVSETPEVSCGDGLDNDCDNLVDSADPDCGATCIPTTKKERGFVCNDGIDNDCDGLIDAADPDC